MTHGLVSTRGSTSEIRSCSQDIHQMGASEWFLNALQKCIDTGTVV